MASYHFIETAGSAPNAPLFLTFHGTGGDEHQFHGLAAQLASGAHVISPHGDVSEHGAARFFRRTGEGVYDMADLAERTQAMARFIIQQKQRTGADRVMAMGFSNGANILASVMLTHPQIVDEAALLHPLIPWQPAPQPGLAGRRVLVAAGRRDPICPPDLTRQLNRYLAAQGAELTEYWSEGGHGIDQPEVQAIAAFFGPHHH